RERWPGEDRHAVRALEERVCLADPLLVLADQLRDDHLLRGEVGRGRRAAGRASRGGGGGPSQTITARRAPSLPRTRPPGSPSSASPITSAATTKVVCVAEPLVTSTNQGSASQVICAPVVETTSATSSARIERSRRSSLRLTRPPPATRAGAGTARAAARARREARPPSRSRASAAARSRSRAPHRQASPAAGLRS